MGPGLELECWFGKRKSGKTKERTVMSAFEYIPTPLPLEINPAQQPIEYTLKADRNDPVIAIAFYIAGIAFFFLLIYGTANPLGFIEPDGDRLLATIGTICSIAVLWVFGSKIARKLQILKLHLTVEIKDNIVTVTCLQGKCENFSCPLTDYAGLATEERGEEYFNDKKRKISTLMLIHQNQARSIPLMVTDTKKLGKKKIKIYAAQLGLPVLPFDYVSKLQSTLPAGTILANVRQAVKIRYVTWGLYLASAAMVAAALYIGQNWGLSPADGRVLKPLGQRLAFAGILIGLAIAASAGMYYYCHVYLTSILHKDDELHLTTILGKKRIYSINDLTGFKEFSGKMNTKPTRFDGSAHFVINTPFLWLYFTRSGKQKRYLADLQSEFIVKKALKDIIKKASSKANSNLE